MNQTCSPVTAPLPAVLSSLTPKQWGYAVPERLLATP